MIYYNSNTINDWNFGDDNIIKVYKHGAVCYYKITSGDTPTPVQEPCFAVVNDISQYTDTEFEDVYDKATEKWFKLNNLNQYEEYGIYGSGKNITYYEGKLTVDDGYEYEWNGSSWINLGEVSGSSKTSDFTIGDINDNVTVKSSIADGDYYVISFYNNNNPKEPRYMMSYTESNNYLNNFSGHTGSNTITPSTIIDAAIWKFEATSSANTYYIKNIHNNLYWGYQTRASNRSLNLVDSSSSSKAIVKVGVANSSTTVGFLELNVNGSSYTYEDGTVGGYALNQLYGYTYMMNWWNTGGWGSDGNSAYYLYKINANNAEYPKYYSEQSDPPDNLVFSSMAEAEAYECPWVGMHATIDGDKYVFSGDSQSGYEWVYNPSRLPDGYTEVEYIENTSTAYINLGVSPYSVNGNSFIVESTFSSFTQSSLAYLISTEYTTSPYYGFILRWVNNNLILDGASIGIDTTATNIPNGDGTSAITFYSDSTTTSNNNTPITLFCGMNGSSPWRNGKGKCYSFKLTINNNIVRDLVPAKRDSDDKYGMYDLITDTFYLSPNNVDLSGGDPV